MKYIKYVVLLLVLMLAGCTNAQVDDIKDSIVIEYVDNDTKNSVQNDLSIPTTVDGITVNWTSNSEFAVIDNDKVIINRQNEDVKVILTATFEVDSKSYKKDYEIVIRKTTLDFDTLFGSIIIPEETDISLDLPTTIDGYSVSWVSSDLSVMSNSGVISSTTTDKDVVLTATISVDGATRNKAFPVKVLGNNTFNLQDFKNFFAIPTRTSTNLLLKTEYQGNTVTWTSSSNSVLNNQGVVERKSSDVSVVLTASITINNQTFKQLFVVTVLKQEIQEPNYEEILGKISLPQETIEDLVLPTTIDGVTLTWTTNSSALSSTGVVTRQLEDVNVTLTVTVDADTTYTKDFLIKVIKNEVETPDYNVILNKITVPAQTSINLVLPATVDGVNINWSSNNNAISNMGVINRQANDVAVELTATIKEDSSFSKTFTVIVLKKGEFPVSNETPIAEVRLMAQGTSVTVQGVITSLMSNGNFTIQDSTGAIPVYFGSGKNTAVQVGTEYVIKGSLGQFNGLIQINAPEIVQTLGVKTLPTGIDLTGYSLEFDDVILYEANVVTYLNLEVTDKQTPNNALELYLRNEAGETTFVRLDTRVNNSPFPFDTISIGEIIDLYDVTVGQYASKAQFLFTNRSSIEAKPKNPEIISIYGSTNINFIIGDPVPNFLEGITAKNGFGATFTHLLDTDISEVNLNEAGNYKVKVFLTSDPTNFVTYTVYVRKQVEAGVYDGYYQRLSGLSGSALIGELRSLIMNTGSATGSTSQVQSVDRVGNSYYLIYDGMGSYGNKEHVWPQSKLGSTKDDLHNLRAANSGTNSRRSNYPFAEDNKPFTGSQPYQLIGSSWYPGDEHIGDVARIVFYVSIRYDLSLNAVGNLNTFLEWHELDPVNDFERNRNDKIYGIQNNRNPFIDHPELVEVYFGGGNTMKTSLALIDLTLNMTMDNRRYHFQGLHS